MTSVTDNTVNITIGCFVIDEDDFLDELKEEQLRDTALIQLRQKVELGEIFRGCTL